MFLATSNNKLTAQIVSQVRDAILNGKLQPGERLPTEKELLLQFGVSKHTLREALRALESMVSSRFVRARAVGRSSVKSTWTTPGT